MTSRLLKWLLGALLAIVIGLLLAALSLTHVTAEGPGTRALERSAGILFEIDTYLDVHYGALQEQAAASPASEAIVMPELPMEIAFTASDIARSTRQSFRALLLTSIATRIRQDGVAAFRDGRDAEGSVASSPGAVRSGQDFLRPTPYRALTVTTFILAAIAAMLAAALAMSCRGYGRLLAVGPGVLAGAVPFLLVAALVRLALRSAGHDADDYLLREFAQLAQELAWAPIRDGMIWLVAGAIATAAGWLLALWDGSRRQPST